MREYDNSFSDEVYEALAWAGLKGGEILSPTSGLPINNNPTKAWENVPLNERLSINQVYDDFKNNNENCN